MRRWLLIAAVAAVVAGATAVWAIARSADIGPPTATGCLTATGDLRSFAIGDSPTRACKASDTQLQLSGGDITSVDTPAEGGLAGGSASGSALLSLQQRFRLPLGCADGDVAHWSSTLQLWSCGQATGSRAYEAFRQSVPLTIVAVGGFFDSQKVLTLHLPAGKYTASVYLDVRKDNGSGTLVCNTFARAPGEGNVLIIQTLAVGTSTLSGATVYALPSDGTIEMWCRQGFGATGASPVVVLAEITASSVADWTSTEDTSAGNQYGP